jgi:hypothetical protein
MIVFMRVWAKNASITVYQQHLKLWFLFLSFESKASSKLGVNFVLICYVSVTWIKSISFPRSEQNRTYVRNFEMSAFFV